jgi:uncharacterized protein YjiS (DUF1127 family)
LPAVTGIIFTSMEGRFLPGTLVQTRAQRQEPSMPETGSRAMMSRNQRDRGDSDPPSAVALTSEPPMSSAAATARGVRQRHPRGIPDRLFQAVRRAAAGLVFLLLEWQERARQRHHLRGLSDYMLKDLNLSRADVERESSKSFWHL